MNESEADKIIDLIINSDKYRTVDSVTDSQRAMMRDAICIASMLNGRESVDDFDIDLKENVIVFTKKSYFNKLETKTNE